MNKFLKNRKLKIHFKKDIEPHEILLDKLAKKKEEELDISEKKFEVPLLKKVLQGFFWFSISLILILFLRTFQLQVIEGKNFLAQADENKYILHKIQAERGVIYDRNLKQLVFNRPSFDLVCEKNNLPESEIERREIFKEVSQILKINFKDLEKKIKEAEGPTISISENLDHYTLIILETKIGELPGFKIVKNSIREYQEGVNFSHLIGYVGKIKSEELKAEPEFYSIFDYVGRDGIEKSYEKALRENPGELRIERDALGNIISKKIISLPESGESLVLWLDFDLQKKIKEELEKELQLIGSKKAAAVALDPKTGGVLSLVSLPSFDNNVFSKGDFETLEKLLGNPDEPLFNRVIAAKYPTGSTIKPLIALAALEEKKISANKKINCQGKIVVEDFWDPEKTWEYEDWRTHGWTDLRKAIAESCNVYFYHLGGGYGTQEGLGPTKIKSYLELFGWGDKTGVDLPGEVGGFIPDKEWKKRVWGQGWWDGDTYLLSIGQGYLLITPLEVAASFLPIANGGKLLKPRVVQKIIDVSTSSIQATGSVQAVKEIGPEIIRENFINPRNLQIVREGMRQAVSGENSPHASAVLLNSLPVLAAAKTGTAETPKENYYHNWITVFAPYEDPEILLTVILQDVEGVRAAALPVAKAILEWYFTR
ncbi:MAG: penicillin-binding protein 2 [Candidatus Paceibacterales bacterium]